ncbi:16S rRNA (cytosine(1402)-N(4))-methyltransferase RsmH [Persephonella sp.]
MIEHYPVLHREVLQFFSPIKEGYIVDATVGGGGHSYLILKKFPQVKIIGIDRDETALKRAEEKLREFAGRYTLVHSSFKNIDKVLQSLKISCVSGFLFDLGVSMFQLKTDRGFSFQREEPLDMRMDTSQHLTAYQVVNQYPKPVLEKILFQYGEEKFAKKIAKMIAEYRKKKPIETTKELADIVVKAYPPSLRRGRIHPATRTFQAVRIEVNKELEEIKEGVSKALDLTEKGGIIQVISFHSLEDRIVKNIFKEAKKLKKIEILTKKPITPSEEEIKENPPSRSAKLRVAKRV